MTAVKAHTHRNVNRVGFTAVSVGEPINTNQIKSHIIYMYVYVHVHIYIRTYIHTYVHTYIHIPIYIHTYVYTYILI